MNLADVAAAFGYAHATTFIRAFTRWSGQTPAQWRRSGTVAPSGCEATRGLDDRADEARLGHLPLSQIVDAPSGLSDCSRDASLRLQREGHGGAP